MTAEADHCERCGVIRKGHPDASKNGGLPLNETDDGILCPVCEDWLDREATPQWPPPDLLRDASADDDRTQTTLTDQ